MEANVIETIGLEDVHDAKPILELAGGITGQREIPTVMISTQVGGTAIDGELPPLGAELAHAELDRLRRIAPVAALQIHLEFIKIGGEFIPSFKPIGEIDHKLELAVIRRAHHVEAAILKGVGAASDTNTPVELRINGSSPQKPIFERPHHPG